MSEERVRREVRELVDGFGPPSAGLAARAVAGLPDRRGATRPFPRLAAAVAGLLVLVAVALWAAPRVDRGPAAPAGRSGLAELRQRPLVNVPLTGPSCQVDERRTNVRADAGQVTIVSASSVPLGGLMTVQAVSKATALTTIAVGAGPEVSGSVLLRGHRLDGPGTLAFAPAPARGGPYRGELVVDVGAGARRWDVSVRASKPGCYAIQLDGARFTEVAVLLLYPDSTGAPSDGPPAQTMTAAQAAAEVRADSTGVQPLLLPTAVGAGWRAEVVASPTSFSVRYADATPPGVVTLAVEVANLPLPGPGTTQTAPGFRGDPHSLYQVTDGRDPVSARFLVWSEPTGVSYLMSATGMTDAEFWQIANSLR